MPVVSLMQMEKILWLLSLANNLPPARASEGAGEATPWPAGLGHPCCGAAAPRLEPSLTQKGKDTWRSTGSFLPCPLMGPCSQGSSGPGVTLQVVVGVTGETRWLPSSLGHFLPSHLSLSGAVSGSALGESSFGHFALIALELPRELQARSWRDSPQSQTR